MTATSEKVEELIARQRYTASLNQICGTTGTDAADAADLLSSLNAQVETATKALREISACIFDDNGDVTWSPMDIKRIVRAALSALEAK